MSVIMSMRWSGVTPEQYDRTCELIDWDELPSLGGILHAASFDDGAMHVLDVWESQEHFQRFLETRLQPAIAQVGMEGQPEVEFRPLHSLWSQSAHTAAKAN